MPQRFFFVSAFLSLFPSFLKNLDRVEVDFSASAPGRPATRAIPIARSGGAEDVNRDQVNFHSVYARASTYTVHSDVQVSCTVMLASDAGAGSCKRAAIHAARSSLVGFSRPSISLR